MIRPASILAAFLLILISMPAFAAGPPQAGKTVSFLTGPEQGDAYDIAHAYIQSHREELGLTTADVEAMMVRDRYVTRHNGVTHMYLQQRLDGIEVWNGIINVNVARDGSIINLGNGFISDLAGKANARVPEITDRTAIERAAEHFGLTPDGLALLVSDGGPDSRATFSDAALSSDEIPVRLVYQPLRDGGARLAWETIFNMVANPDWWNVLVDAATGEVLQQDNYTDYDSYLAIPIPPFSDPEDSGGQATLTDPADATASPFGWHDTNGIAGAESTETLGNNVDAHEDLDGSNGTPGARAEGGPTLDFAYPFTPAQQPAEGTNLDAAIVNLFYVNNVMHDLTYQYGFDEPAGNFQTNNYGNGGLGSDAVQADAQDGSGTNNATFGTSADGIAPRMTMFVWTPPPLLTVNSPAGIAGDYTTGSATFGALLDGIGITGDLEYANDGDDDGGTGTVNDGCQPLVGFTAGRVAVIDRGACEFGTKVLNAENANAIAAIVVNNQGDATLTMGPGADGGSVTISSVFIGQSDGDLIKANLPAPGVNATMALANTINRDSDFDNGVVAHEYGHGISNRLTGGPSTASCLPNPGDIGEQAGEGWSDFWSLVLTAKSSDTPTLAKGVGNYLDFKPINGSGIRNFPYTTDLGVNPQTYADIGSTNVPHGVGEIWMDMVWEMYWELVTKHGFDADIYNGTGGNNLTIQLVIDGMKLQPCAPDFVEARDAILAADLANNGGDNECEIWRAFTKRGLGENAVSGDPPGIPVVGNETENFTLPAACPAVAPSLFTDGFESGDTARWSNTTGG